MPSTPTVLLTRPEAASRRFAAALRDRLGGGVAVLIAPVLDIVLDPRAAAAAMAGAGGAILSSENGAAAFAGASAFAGAGAGVGAGLPAFCVGARTAAAARAAGLVPAAYPPGDLDGLLAQIVAAGWPADRGPLVHLHGAHVTGDAAAALAAHGIAARSAVVYDQRARPLSGAALRLLAGEDPVVVPVFSPRSARLLAPALAAARAPLRLAAISPRAAAALDVQSAARVCTAARPDAAAMGDAVAALVLGRSSA